MKYYNKILLALLPYRHIDPAINKFRVLLKEYERENRAHFGEYLSSFLYD